MRIGQKASTPKILVHDNGIVNALKGISYAGFLADKDYYGRVFENSIGINLYNSAKIVSGEIFYWRERNYEVDYVVKAHGIISAIEVKSGNSDVDVKGLKAFKRKYPEAVLIVISKKEVKIDGVTWVNPVNYFNNPEIIFVI
jgi:predicted AAA+ superfamily ATPase